MGRSRARNKPLSLPHPRSNSSAQLGGSGRRGGAEAGGRRGRERRRTPACTHCSGCKAKAATPPDSQGHRLFLPFPAEKEPPRLNVYRGCASTSQTPTRRAQRPPRVGPGAAGRPRRGGCVEGEGPQRPPAAHAQCRAPARLPTVGTAKPRSPASAASPEPLATSTRRERRPEVTRRPAGLLPRRPPARG